MKKISVSLLILLMVPIVSYSADWGSKFFDDMKNNSQLRKSANVQTQGSSTFSGGGWTWEGSNASLQPFSVKAPTVSAGCGGISFDFGAFSFISDPDKLIEFLESLLDAAPGYAFEMALQTFCPSCLDIMNTLNQISNTINGLQFDACGTLKNLGNLASQAVSTYTDTTMLQGGINSFNEGIEKYAVEPLQTFNEVLDGLFACAMGDKGCPLKMFKSNGSLLEIAIERLPEETTRNILTLVKPSFPDDITLLARILASGVGDLIIIDPTEGNKNTEGSGGQPRIIALDTTQWKVSNSEAGMKNARQFIMGLTYAIWDIPTNMEAVPDKAWFWVPTFNKISDGKGGHKIDPVNPRGEDMKMDIQPIQYHASNELDKVAEAFVARGKEMDTDTLAFLSSFKTPVYKILNTYSVSDQALNQFIKSFEHLAGAQLTYEMFSVLFREVIGAIDDIRAEVIASGIDLETSNFEYKVEQIVSRLSALQAAAYNVYVEAYDNFYTSMQKTKYLEDMQKIQRAMMARHPIVGSKTFLPSIGL